MVANDNKYMTSAVESVYLTNEDRNAIKIAREREDYLRHEAYQKEQIKKLTKENKKLKNVNAEKDAIIKKYKEKFQKYLDDVNAASGKPYKVRASIGAQSALITEDLSIENIIAKADKLMYSEKSSKKRSVIR